MPRNSGPNSLKVERSQVTAVNSNAIGPQEVRVQVKDNSRTSCVQGLLQASRPGSRSKHRFKVHQVSTVNEALLYVSKKALDLSSKFGLITR